MELQQAFAVLFSYGIGSALKHLVPQVPNGAIPFIVPFIPPVTNAAVSAVTGFDPFPNSMVDNMALGGLAVALHGAGKHLGESMGIIEKK